MLWTAFLLGLAGSLHCAGMCGPLALALPATGGSAVSYTAGRLAYNGGRLVTYSVLGLLFGLVGRSLTLVGIQRWLSLAAGLLLLLGLVASRQAAWGGPMIQTVGWLKSALAALLRRRSFTSLGLLGMLNGLLPCGLVYAACVGAAATGGVLAGGQYMALFGLGTVPLMLGISLSGRAVPVAWRFKLQRLVPVSLAVVATLLILRGLALGIPYLSPDLAADGAACCH